MTICPDLSPESVGNMAFKIKFSADCARDFEAIFDHLFASYIGFGESAEQAVDHAALRIAAIRHAAATLAASPMRGTLRHDVLPSVRHITIDRAIYRFDVDSAARTISAICSCACCATTKRSDKAILYVRAPSGEMPPTPHAFGFSENIASTPSSPPPAACQPSLENARLRIGFPVSLGWRKVSSRLPSRSPRRIAPFS